MQYARKPADTLARASDLRQVGSSQPDMIHRTLSQRKAYRLYFHPLKDFPGPRLAAVSGWYQFYYEVIAGGQYIFHLLHLSRLRDWSIIRLAPNHLHINDPKLFQEVFKPGTEFQRDPAFYKSLPLANSLAALSDFKQHGARRKQLNPVFTPSAVAEGLPTLRRNIADIGELLSQSIAYGDPVDIQATFFYMTVAEAGEISQYCESQIHATVERRQQQPEQSCQRKILCEVLLDSKAEKERMTAENIKYIIDESVLFMFVGTDTTAYALSLGVYLLLTHPEPLRKLKSELRKAEPAIRSQDWTRIQKLPYLAVVIEEVLRISCPVPGLLPRVVPPQGCFVGSKFIPGGTVISLGLSSISSNDTIFADPSAFCLERWLDAEEQKILQWKVQFSLGLYACIGMKLSLMEMAMSLAYIFSRFELELHETDADTVRAYDYLLAKTKSHVQVKATKDNWRES
ncbi:cytochrome P450 [Aspergillus granulosus]|uniref:Cytochrome P450 n=1 Tax=Aspergillus granulosus TaxID=176169 RepID=A0ABR4H165_9EURO